MPTSALAQSVGFSEDMMNVHLTDSRILSVLLIWFLVLYQVTPAQREHGKIGAGSRGLHWPVLDGDISIAGLMAGVDTQSA